MRTLSIIALAMTIYAPLGHAQDNVTTYVPSNTTVAVLPVINLSGEHDAKFDSEQVKAASEELHNQFSARGFRVLGDNVVTEAIASNKIDLTDEGQRSIKTLLSLGEAAKADLAAFVVIDQVKAVHPTVPGSAYIEGHATITMWLVDVKQQKPILSAIQQEGIYDKSLPFRAKGSTKIIRACAEAVKQGLDRILKPYPVDKQKTSPTK